ncbi:MAG: lysophospholipid acyltransferase family protein [Candidatus Euphemobacter frigidus]|nr:lysophospholipid acyltransferase family protein [Candidatus Euphemobacter frigidus]MDP8276220.1 lysophospholipid acyltransferase family protein [Candidatus Euphemobacter frigidus]
MTSNRIISLASKCASWYTRLVGVSSHWHVRGDEPVWELFREEKPVIFAFWHNRFIMMPYIYRFRFRKERIAVIVSLSRDGELVGRFLGRYCFKVVRGSSSRGGKRAFLKLIRSLRNGWDVAVTPDGPRGPRYRIQDGIISLASVSGAPIVPVSYASSLRFVFKGSWDHFRLPLPCSRIKLVFAPPLRVGREVKERERSGLREELRRRLRQADRTAEEVIGG